MSKAESPESHDLLRIEERSDGVVLLTLDNGRVNPLSVELLKSIEQAASTVAMDARAVLITGNQRAFAAGADITQFTEHGGVEPFAIAGLERLTDIGGSFLQALNAVASIRCPTIAAVSGVALGGGCELAMACDFRVASANSRFGQPEILLGIIPGGGGTQRLARLVGPARAKDLIFTGRTIDGVEAHRIGLVDRLVDGEDVLGAAVAWARELAAGPRHALALAKSAIDGGLEGPLSSGLALEQDLFVRSFATPDAAVGVESFLNEGPGRADFA